MKYSLAGFVCLALLMSTIPGRGADNPAQSNAGTPVLVELFTSEGCSSCPPADRFLVELDRQVIPGAELVVLSEHVDYWDHDGWKDRFSSSSITDRQKEYGQHFNLNDVYTPEMVVDGATQFNGSNTQKATQAIESLERAPTVAVHLSSISFNRPHTLEAHVETGALEDSFKAKSADVYVALAIDHADTQVSGGENKGNHMSHVSVLRTLNKVGEVKRGQNFARDVSVKLDSSIDVHNLRVIAFLQEPHQGKVLGATYVVNPS